MTVLLVASGGGHLRQLHQLLARTRLAEEDRLWITFDTGLARGLLVGEHVHYVRYVRPHAPIGTLRTALVALPLLSKERFEFAVSTGANLAVALLPTARLLGAEAHFIESAARATERSSTARILEKVPGIELHVQHESMANDRWRYSGSVLDGFQAQDDSTRAVNRVVVTVGTNESYGFRRLIEHLVQVIPTDAEVMWQTGSTDVTGLGIDGRKTVPSNELDDAMRKADVVIAHAGMGSALSAMQAGAFPVFVPRRSEFKEHIDDHQVDTAKDLAQRDLCMMREATAITSEDLRIAASRRITNSETVQFSL